MNCRLSLGWRWAFLLQLPLFAISFILTAFNLHYVTPVCSRDVLLLFFFPAELVRPGILSRGGVRARRRC